MDRRTPQVIREGSIVMIDDGCDVEGYQSDITRTFVLGKSSDKMKKNFEIVHRAQSAALAAARPGVECGAVDAAARKVITDAGYGPDYKYFTHRLGHGMGMDGHEWPYLVARQYDQTSTQHDFQRRARHLYSRRIRHSPRRRHAHHRKRRRAVHAAKFVTGRSLPESLMAGVPSRSDLHQRNCRRYS